MTSRVLLLCLLYSAVITLVTVATLYLTTLFGTIGTRVVAIAAPTLTVAGMLTAFFRRHALIAWASSPSVRLPMRRGKALPTGPAST